jgi:hypothetical protein
MDVADVASLDGAVQAWDRWMGCILCPDPAGIEEKVNLLEKGEKVLTLTLNPNPNPNP